MTKKNNDQNLIKDPKLIENVEKTDDDREFADSEFVVYKDSYEEQNVSKQEKELSEKILVDSTEKVLENRTSKSKIINISFFVISIFILVGTLIYQRNKYGVSDITSLTGVKYRYIFYILLVFALVMLFDSLRTHVLIFKATKLHRPFLSYKSTAICRYYDCITPFSFGGQPFQIFYLNSRGVKAGIASSVPLAKYMFSQISFCIISLVMLIVGITKYNESVQVVVTWSIISLCISIFFLALIVFLSISKRVAPRITMWFIKILHKLKIVKNPKLTFTKIIRQLTEYRRSIIYYLKSFWTTVFTFALSILIILLKATIPYLIYCFLVPDPNVSFTLIFIKFLLCELASTYIPLPGGSGMAEISFSSLFASLFLDSSGSLFWALLIYRIATYYLYIIQGFGIIVYDLVYGDKKNKKFVETKLIDMQLKANKKYNHKLTK